MRRVRTLLAAAWLLIALGPAPAGAETGFGAWLAALRTEAARRGISAATLDLALADLAPLPRVVELDRRQPERTLTLARYLDRVVTRDRVERGQVRLAEHRALLGAVAERYGVPSGIVVALWGIESDYGRDTGSFPVIGALATLAYEGRRGAFFREELLQALRIVDEGHAPVGDLVGSWAGAFGQSQFMPSSYLRYAVDFDADGRRDLWRSPADVLGSIGHYLAAVGWRRGIPWGHRVRVPAGPGYGAGEATAARRLSDWQRLGVRRADGRELPAGDQTATLLRFVGPSAPSYLVTENYRVVLRWNNSQLFAVAVGELADRIAGSAPQ